MPTFVQSGARSRFVIDGRIVAFASGVSASESIQYEAIDVLDLLEVKEYVPVAYRATLSAQIFRVVGQSLKAMGIFPIEDDILTKGEMVATVEDRLSGQVLATFQSVKAEENSWDVSARGVVSSNVTFNAIRVKDEAELPA